MTTLTMQDIADLAKVRRPVVSMWRKRPVAHGVSALFPEPVAVVDGVARFARDEVVEWIERTGRGNNPDHRYDAAALAVPDGVTLDEIVTLLCWHVLTGRDLAGTSLAERIEHAAECDPDDSVLLREIRNLRPAANALEFVDGLVEASFGAPDALARLERGRLQRVRGVRDLTPGAIDLVRCIVGACAKHLDRVGVALVRADDTALSLEVAAGFDHYSVEGETDHDRAIRRCAVIREVPIDAASTTATVRVSSVIGHSVADALDRADAVVLGLRPGDIAVVLGSAKALCDNLAGAAQHRRAHTLRDGNLVAALRLPRGLWREAHRQSLAVWICVGGANVREPWVADLGAADSVVLDDVAADVAGALGQSEHRAFRYARRTELASVLAAGALVPRGVRAARLRAADSTSHLERVHAATLTTTTPLDPFDVLVAPSPGRFRLRHRSLGELKANGLLVMKRGSRIDPKDASPEGSVVVHSVEVVGSLALDPFDAARKYPRAARTDPNDVIFVERPHPRAWVDSIGGAMVASPARILRLDAKADVGPRMLATIINDATAAGTEWQTWNVPVMTREEADRLEDALIGAERFEAEVRRRSDAVRELKRALIDGIAAGALTLDAQPTTPGIAAAQP